MNTWGLSIQKARTMHRASATMNFRNGKKGMGETIGGGKVGAPVQKKGGKGEDTLRNLKTE